MRCNKCGGEINTVHLNFFDKEGSDSEESISFTECEEDALVMDVDSSWVGYGLSEEEQIEDIRCPICGGFPFSQNEVQVYDVVKIVCFHEEENKATTEKTSAVLTDAEIKKALECCSKSRSMADCKQMCCPASTPITCSYFLRTDDDFEGGIYVELIKDALDLINRKDAEIESFENCERILICQLAEEREKTIKEYVRKYKAEVNERYEDIAYKDLFFGVIDYVAKEMEGETV